MNASHPARQVYYGPPDHVPILLMNSGIHPGAVSVVAFTTGWDYVQMRHVLLAVPHVEVPDDLPLVEVCFIVDMGLPIHSFDQDSTIPMRFLTPRM